MASLITHPVVPLSLGIAFGGQWIPRFAVITGIVFSLLPDADVIAFRFGIPYGHMLGHRGASHSIMFAMLLASAAVALPAFNGMRLRIFGFLFISALSHGILDAMTTGGLGVGFLIPFSPDRYFLPLRPIRVSPLSVDGFFTQRGLQIFVSELLAVWLPCGIFALTAWLIRRWSGRGENS